MGRAPPPFQWNTGNPRLGRRLRQRGRPPRLSAAQKEHLLRAAAQVLRATGDADLVFVGRSLENLHDLISGLLVRTSWYDRTQRLQVSMRGWSVEKSERIERLWPCLRARNLTPAQILRRERPVALIDVIYTGGTFKALLELFRVGVDGEDTWLAVQDRLRFVCLVAEAHPVDDPDAFEWAAGLKAEQVRRIPIDWRLWDYLADLQTKTTRSYVPFGWWEAVPTRAPIDPRRLRAARLARSLYRLGERSRRRIAQALERPPASEPWRAALIRELWLNA